MSLSSTVGALLRDSFGAIFGVLENPLRVDPTGTTVQPVSGAVSISGGIAGTVSVSNFPASQPVTGAFYQATQPVSGTLSISNFPSTQAVSGTFWQSTQPVSGTFWQSTQPISGTIGVNNFPATQSVSGTFWQATQPISGTVTANQGGTWSDDVTDRSTRLLGHVTVDSAPTTAVTNTGLSNLDVTLSTRLKAGDTLTGVTTVAAVTSITNPVAVTGTFWQGTQPVSGTFWQGTQPVSGTFWQATQPVSGTFWQVTQPVSGTVTVNAGTNLNTSALALEAGGNLATLTAKDFATQATLALIKTKTDNLDVLLSTAATSAKQDTINTNLSQIDTDLADLRISQATSLAAQRGPMVMAVTNDTPSSFIDNTFQPLSLTPQGRLRVSSVNADFGSVWESFYDNPWADSTVPWGTTENISYV